MDIKHIIRVHVYEPPEENRVQHKFRKKTIFNSLYVQWRHQKGLRFHHEELKRHIEYFFHENSMPWEDCGQEWEEKILFCFWDTMNYYIIMCTAFRGLTLLHLRGFPIFRDITAGSQHSPVAISATGFTTFKYSFDMVQWCPWKQAKIAK